MEAAHILPHIKSSTACTIGGGWACPFTGIDSVLLEDLLTMALPVSRESNFLVMYATANHSRLIGLGCDQLQIENEDYTG